MHANGIFPPLNNGKVHVNQFDNGLSAIVCRNRVPKDCMSNVE